MLSILRVRYAGLARFNGHCFLGDLFHGEPGFFKTLFSLFVNNEGDSANPLSPIMNPEKVTRFSASLNQNSVSDNTNLRYPNMNSESPTANTLFLV